MKLEEPIIKVFFFTGVRTHSGLLKTLSKVNSLLLLAVSPAL
jgi:hypothetical protein